jgi:hypothetical protein
MTRPPAGRVPRVLGAVVSRVLMRAAGFTTGAQDFHNSCLLNQICDVLPVIGANRGL